MFDMRGLVGQEWSKQLQESPELKQKYAECSKSYPLQRALRAKWATEQFVAVSKTS